MHEPAGIPGWDREGNGAARTDARSNAGVCWPGQGSDLQVAAASVGWSNCGVDAAHLICLYCKGRIGSYEPVIVIEHEGERETSLAQEPDLRDRVRALVVHRECAPYGWRAH